MLGKITKLMVGLAMFILPASISAQSYIPDVLELDGTETLEFPADDRVQLADGATIEFWVAPDWKEDPGYDPVILSNRGNSGYSYMIAMLRDRNGIGIISGGEVDLAPFDFTDGKLHHVAIIDYSDSIMVFVDNIAVADLDMSLRSLPSTGFWIGSSDGENAPFIGAVAGLRLWDTAVDPDIIAEYAMMDVLDNEQPTHPDIDWLIGVSDFRNKDFRLTDFAPAGDAP